MSIRFAPDKKQTGNLLTAELVRGSTIYTQLRQLIKEYIVRNGLRPGDPLPSEGDLAARLGVSRGSIREAVKALDALGVVEVRHGNGLFVRSLNLDAALESLSYTLDSDPSTVAELAQIRKWLETATLSEVVVLADDEAISAMEQTLADWKAHIPSGDWGVYDRQFHAQLAEITKNRLLVLFLDLFWQVYFNSLNPAIRTSPDPIATCANHERVLDAVKARDAQAACQALQDSYINLEQRVKSALQSEPAGE